MVDIDVDDVIDNAPSSRFPIYTRANVGEIAPGPALPLTYASAMAGLEFERSWRRALVRFGAFDLDEFDPVNKELIGVFHGYPYPNLSVQRVLGVRMPGASPGIVDASFFGSNADVPPASPIRGTRVRSTPPASQRPSRGSQRSRNCPNCSSIERRSTSGGRSARTSPRWTAVRSSSMRVSSLARSTPRPWSSTCSSSRSRRSRSGCCRGSSTASASWTPSWGCSAGWVMWNPPGRPRVSGT